MRSLSICVSDYLHDEKGATAIEYALLASLIGVGLIVGAGLMTGAIDNMFRDVNSDLVQALDIPENP